MSDMLPSYCHNFNTYQRIKTREVFVGHIPLGNGHPVRIQSMTNTLTSDIKATVGQIIRIHEAGADYVRLTIPSLKDTDSLKEIVKELRKRNFTVPIIADVHFNPRIALISATLAQKVRINPGNFTDRKHDNKEEYSEQEYKSELIYLKEKLLELIAVCSEYKTALRIGTNHGSLSERIMDRYGDTPEGMAESVMEFLRICREAQFSDVVISMKASNTRIMVYANRLLVHKMKQETMHFPLHLGVTEAGEGEDGRIKSAVGIGTLLSEGIGDTVRVSLTEDPEVEIPVARKLVQFITLRNNHDPIPPFGNCPIDPFNYSKRKTVEVEGIGGTNVPVVVHTLTDGVTKKNLEKCGWNHSGNGEWIFADSSPDIICCDYWPDDIPVPEQKHYILSSNKFADSDRKGNLILRSPWEDYQDKKKPVSRPRFLHIESSNLIQDKIDCITRDQGVVIVLETNNANACADMRSAVFRLINSGNKNPVIFRLLFKENDKEDFQLKAAAELGGLFIDGLGDGIWLENTGSISTNDIVSTAFGILQASRVRMSRTEYISCPSCGRTLFDLQTVTRKIRERTSHLKGLKIGIMGCIVNGPGEMADADYGYVGTGKGNVTLYKEKTVIKRNVPEHEAVDELVQLIKENGDWIDPSLR